MQDLTHINPIPRGQPSTTRGSRVRARARRSLLGAALAAVPVIALLGVACSSGASSPKSTPAASLGSSAEASAANPATGAGRSAASTTKQPKYTNAADLVAATEPAVVRIETNSGVGSGFIVSADGYVITNNHVIASSSPRAAASTIRVTLDDLSQKTAAVVGADPRSDLAVLKIDGTNLPFLTIGNLANVAVGEDLIAIGYALDLPTAGGSVGAPTVTRGIVSAKNRAISEQDVVLGAIQTDTAINHGNSGGPLIDFNGAVVGVNTSLVPDPETGGAASGIGLAVGADTVSAVFDQIKATGKVSRGLLGIQRFVALRPGNAKDLGLQAGLTGLYLPAQTQATGTVARTAPAPSVASTGPAGKAGIQPGDVITKIAGATIGDEADLAVALIKHHPGETVAIEVSRGGKLQTLQVVLGTPTA